MSEHGRSQEEINELINQLLSDESAVVFVQRRPIVRTIDQPPPLGQSRLRRLGEGIMHQLDLIMTGENPDCWPFRK